MSVNQEFSKSNIIDRTLPEELSHLITQAEYDRITDIAIQYFKEKGDPVTGINDGCLYVKAENMVQRFGLENLVREVVMAKAENWEAVIYTRFNHCDFSISAHNFFMKDYEHARQYLRILIKPLSFIEDSPVKNFVFKTHFPRTASLLVFNYNHQFWFLTEDHIKNWQQPHDTLFKQALDNVAAETTEEKVNELEPGVQLYIILSNDFSAARMIQMERNVPYLLGAYGVMFSIPAKGAAFGIPVHDLQKAQQIMAVLLRVTLIATDIETGPVVPDIFWYHMGRIHSLKVNISKNREITLQVPDKWQKYNGN